MPFLFNQLLKSVLLIEVGRLANMVLGKFAVNKFAIGKLASGNFAAVKFCTPSIYPSTYTLPSTVHCPVHLHTGPAPSVYTAFRLLGEFSYGKLVYGEFSGHKLILLDTNLSMQLFRKGRKIRIPQNSVGETSLI